MKYLNKFWLSAFALTAMFSCTDDGLMEYTVQKPESIAQMEYLDDYDVLKSYVDRQASPNFKLGTAVATTEFAKQGLVFSFIKSNFDEVVADTDMKHGSVMLASGKLDLTKVQNFIASAKAAGLGVFGHALLWHSGQNSTYLKTAIAPKPNVAEWGIITQNNFETDDASNYSGNANAVMSFTAAGQGYNGTGRALVITNSEVRANDWECQLFITIPNATVAGEQYQLTMDIRSDAEATYPTQAHTTPGGYKHYDFFGQLPSASGWLRFSKAVTIDANTAGCKAIAFNLGKFATKFYFDNMKVEKWYPNGVVPNPERTPEEKKAILTNELDKWIAGIVGDSKGYVKSWTVVNEPMDDAKPYELKSGVGKTWAAGEFYWQDYMGKDYAVEAFKMAAKYGNSDDKLFISDNNLESNIDKCKGLIAYVQYLESKGARVDGIGTQMHMSTSTDKAKIVEMFQLLAATGKLIKVTELDMGVGKQTTAATDDDYKAQAELYNFVVQKYLEIIPAAQRYGITIWSPLDSKAGSGWRAGEPIGLWKENYQRKRAYGGFADGLAKKNIATN